MNLPSVMSAVLLTGFGGPEKLVFKKDVPVPSPGFEEVLIKVGAAAINNTDINTRLGWYSKKVSTATENSNELIVSDDDVKDAAWDGQSLKFPRIQGADVCGTIVRVGDGVSKDRLGSRVIVVPMQRTHPYLKPNSAWTLGADGDGGFAQYVAVRSEEAHSIKSSYSDAELASFPCAYSTAENLLHHAAVTKGESVLITGASGGVGSALLQLAARRGAKVIAVASKPKLLEIGTLGAYILVSRNDPLHDQVEKNSVDVVIDVVAGGFFGELLDVLRPGGRYATAGAIAGPIVELDVRTLYLKDLTLLGRTLQSPEVFPNLVGYIERNEVKPLVAATYPLCHLQKAQEVFMEKSFIGKLVVLPWEE